MDYSLSDSDLKKLAGKGTRVFTYPQLASFKSIDQVVNKKNPKAAILYMTGPNYGHWTGIKLYKNTVQFFDPYGTFPDNQQNKIEQLKGVGFLEETNQIRNKIKELLFNTNKEIHYSDHKLQKLKEGINTCGRWVGYFLSSPLNVDRFASLIKKIAKQSNLSNDETITMLTS